MTPLLSVVVATHERPDDLKRCLEALSRLDNAHEVEVIVVDSASTTPCRAHAERYAFRYVREDVAGLSRARNRGVAEAAAPLVAFADDDAAPHPDWARTLVAPFARDDRIGCVGGSCRPWFGACARPRWLSDRLLQFAGVTRYDGEAREARSSAEWPFGANVAFRATALAEIGGFSERLGRIGKLLLSGEESAAIEALRARGWKIWIEPAAIVDHAVSVERCTPGYYWRRLWWAGVTRARGARRARTAMRLLIAAPIRLFLFLLTRDRVYLYRTAETAGFFVEHLRLRRETQ
jgi:GT2 family glycosyltransferase